jgi:hypothetical protein
MARAFVVMMLTPTFTLRSLMIVAVGHLWPTTITVHLAAKRLLGVLALAATAAAFGTAVSRRSHSAFPRAATTTTAATTTPSTTPATRLAISVSTVVTARSITATVLTFYASITRATR